MYALIFELELREVLRELRKKGKYRGERENEYNHLAIIKEKQEHKQGRGTY